MLLLLVLLLIPVLDAVHTSAEYKVLKTRFGSIRGKRVDSYGGQSAFVFAGIPHAKPPVGELRYRSPQEALPWKGVLDTFQYRNACLSDPAKTFKISEGEEAGPVSEDCLYINVFSSRTCLEKGGCAVMAVYHGGVFKYESPVIFKMEVIVNNFANDERNIVVVTVPYRYGAIGSFHLTEQFKTSIDANVGAKDFIHGLKWIQREISTFGGDPKRVTVYGHSAGAVATQLLALLPITEGLFHQFVAQSGPFNGLLDYVKTANIFASRAVAELAGCAKADESYSTQARIEEITKCMRAVPEQKLLEHYIGINYRVEESKAAWIDGPGGILPGDKKHLMKKLRKIPCLLGTTSAEFRDSRHAVDSTGKVNMTRLTELCSHYAYLRGYHQPESFTQLCADFYSKDNRTQFLDDNLQFHHGIGQLADGFTETGADVFVYDYDYWGAGKVFKKYNPAEVYLGPGHSEDYVYVLGLHRDATAMQPKDFEIERIYTGLIANFINFGDPSYNGYTWSPWKPKKRNFFRIDFDEKLRMPGEMDGYYNMAHEFWEQIVPREIGGFTSPTHFPPHMDSIDLSDIVSNILTAWLGFTNHHDKPYNASYASYKLWADFIQEKRRGFLEKSKVLPRSGDVAVGGEVGGAQENGGGIDWVTLLLCISIIAFITFLLVRKIREYCRRKNYDAYH